MVSVIIPSRNEIFLQKTIKDILSKARGEIEVIAVLDGYWPDPQLEDDPRLRIIHKSEAQGMREAINSGVTIARGEFIMKSDAHCMFDEGFDVKLAADIKPNWVVIPRRHRLEPEAWTLQEVNKPPVDYEYLSFPGDPADFGGPGLHGRKWNERTLERMDKPEYLIDDNMSFQGSCWFMYKSYFYELELMDSKNYGSFHHEAQEIGLKAWLSGGEVKVNKKTWYAHLHKGKKYGRGYFVSKEELDIATRNMNQWIKGNAWHKQKYPLSWLVEKFSPVPSWEGKTLDQEMPIEVPNANRETLTQMFKEKGFKVGAEIGTEQGVFAETICKNNPGVKLFCVDPWEPYKGYREHVTKDKLDNFYEITKDRLKPYNVELIRKYSVDASKDFENESLDFVYIDANHDFANVVADMHAWIPKVKKGGIVAGHDYVRRKGKVGLHVIEAVQNYTKCYGIKPWFILGRKETREGELRDKSRSWYFIKQ